MYGYFYSHLEDYFIYVTLIRRGLDDHQILYHNPYSYLPTKAVLNHPFFMILGQVARIIQVDQYQMYVLARILTVLFMISTVFLLIRKIFSRNSLQQLIATLLVFTSTGIWHIQNVAGLEPMPINPTDDAANYFNAFYRFLLLPPHHFLAMGLFILFLLHIPSIKMSGKSFVITAILSILIIIIQPYYAFYLGPILGLFTLYKLIHSRSQSIPYFMHIGRFFPRGARNRNSQSHRNCLHTICTFRSSLCEEKTDGITCCINPLGVIADCVVSNPLSLYTLWTVSNSPNLFTNSLCNISNARIDVANSTISKNWRDYYSCLC